MSFTSSDLFNNTLEDAFNSSSILNLSTSSFNVINSDGTTHDKDDLQGITCRTPEPLDGRANTHPNSQKDSYKSKDKTLSELTTLTNVTSTPSITTAAPPLQTIPTSLPQLLPMPQNVQTLPAGGIGIPIVINNVDGTPMGTVSVLPANTNGNLVITNTANGPVLQIGTVQLTQDDLTLIQQQLQAKFFQQQATLQVPQVQAAPASQPVNSEPRYLIVNSERQQTQLVSPSTAGGVICAPGTPNVPELKSAPTVAEAISASSPETSEPTAVNTNSDSSSPETTPVANNPIIIPPIMTMHVIKEPLQSEELCDLEDLERFAKKFKERRVELGFTQGDVGASIGHSSPNEFSQTTISRFEAMNLSLKNMNKLRPLLEKWLETHNDNDSCLSSNFGRVVDVEPNSIEGATRRRKRRTTIDNKLKEILEKKFKVKSKPNPEELHKIAEELNIEKGVVRVWFCNRRQKEKKTTIYFSKWLNTG